MNKHKQTFLINWFPWFIFSKSFISRTSESIGLVGFTYFQSCTARVILTVLLKFRHFINMHAFFLLCSNDCYDFIFIILKCTTESRFSYPKTVDRYPKSLKFGNSLTNTSIQCPGIHFKKSHLVWLSNFFRNTKIVN